MHARFRTAFTIFLICAQLMATTDVAIARTSHPDSSLFLTNNPNKLLGIGLGLGAAGAGIGLGIYFSVRHGHMLKGCADSGADGLVLVSEANRQTWSLIGDVSGIRPGERVSVSGSKQKKTAGDSRRFVVERISHDYGPCPVHSSRR